MSHSDEENLNPPEILDLTLQIERAMLQKVAEELQSYLIKTGAPSISAFTLRIPCEAFMINTGLFCYKPKILLHGATRVKMDEYSAIEKETIGIRRPETIVAGYTNYHGNRVVRDLYGIEARYYQHEIDRMMNVDWRTRATQYDRINAVKRVLH